MADKTEMQIKAAEKRLDAIERAIETLRKEAGAQSLGALPQEVKAMKTRVDAIELAVKQLGVQMILKKDLNVEKLMSREQANADISKVKDEVERSRLQAAKMKELSQRELDAAMLRAKSELDTQVKDILKNANAETQRVETIVTKLNVDTRIAVIEARLKTIESRGGR